MSADASDRSIDVQGGGPGITLFTHYYEACLADNPWLLWRCSELAAPVLNYGTDGNVPAEQGIWSPYGSPIFKFPPILPYEKTPVNSFGSFGNIAVESGDGNDGLDIGRVPPASFAVLVKSHITGPSNVFGDAMMSINGQAASTADFVNFTGGLRRRDINLFLFQAGGHEEVIDWAGTSSAFSDMAAHQVVLSKLSSGTWRLHIDGSRIGDEAFSVANVPSIQSIQYPILPGGIVGWAGQLSHFQAYSPPLTDAQVTAHWTAATTYT